VKRAGPTGGGVRRVKIYVCYVKTACWLRFDAELNQLKSTNQLSLSSSYDSGTSESEEAAGWMSNHSAFTIPHFADRPLL